MEAVFERKKRLLPRPTDLSFYNWDSQVSTSNATANFQVNPFKWPSSTIFACNMGRGPIAVMCFINEARSLYVVLESAL